MAVNATDLLFQQSEVVSKKLPEWYSKFQLVSNLVKKMDVTKVGERDFRIPFKSSAGGRAGTYNPNMGAVGRGNRMTGGVMISTFFPYRIAYELAELDIDSTEVAVKQAFKESMKDAPVEFAIFVDKTFHSDGTPLMATATAQVTTSGNTVYTCDNNFGVMRLRVGQYVSVYNSTQATQRAGGPYKVLALDIPNKKVTLNGTVPSAAATDTLLFEGVQGANPTGPKGLYYFIDYTTSGTTLSVNRATTPEIQSNGVDGSGGLNHLLGHQLFTKIFNRRGEMAKGLIGLANPAQQGAVMNLAMNIQRYDVGESNNMLPDLLPEVDMKFRFAGVTHMVDAYQNTTRIDWMNPKLWGKAQLGEGPKFYEVGNQRFFPLYGGDGSPAAGLWFALTLKTDYFSWDPGAQGTLYGLPLLSGY